MTRPVEGFLARDGKFFTSKANCEYYEAYSAVYLIIRQELDAFAFSDEAKDRLSEPIVQGLLNFRSQVQALYDAQDPYNAERPVSIDDGASPPSDSEPDEVVEQPEAHTDPATEPQPPDTTPFFDPDATIEVESPAEPEATIGS